MITTATKTKNTNKDHKKRTIDGGNTVGAKSITIVEAAHLWFLFQLKPLVIKHNRSSLRYEIVSPVAHFDYRSAQTTHGENRITLMKRKPALVKHKFTA